MSTDLSTEHDDLSSRGYPHAERGLDQDCRLCQDVASDPNPDDEGSLTQRVEFAAWKKSPWVQNLANGTACGGILGRSPASYHCSLPRGHAGDHA